MAAGKYYAEAIAWAAGNQIVSGYADGTFRPDAAAVAGYAGEAVAWANVEGLIQGGINPAGKATRAQAAAILQRRS